MQEEPLDEGAEKNDKSQQENWEKWKFALSVLKEAVVSAGIKDISEHKNEPLDLRWHLFFQESDSDVILKMLIKGIFGWINAEISLVMTAKTIVDEVEHILNQPDATRILDFNDEERSEVLRENSRMIISGYINQIPVVAFQTLSQALRDSVQSHIKTFIEPRLKEHWQSLGLPKNFTISPSEAFNNELHTIDEQFKVLRESFLGNKRARLTSERRLHLDEEHEQLRSQYQVAKDYYNQSRKAFFAGKRNRTEDEWVEEWTTQSYRMFPNLSYRSLAEINNYQPYELAYIHLANSYGYSDEYIRKLVTQASNLKPKKPQVDIS
jgi:hypothetical protein